MKELIADLIDANDNAEEAHQMYAHWRDKYIEAAEQIGESLPEGNYIVGEHVIMVEKPELPEGLRMLMMGGGMEEEPRLVVSVAKAKYLNTPKGA